MPQLPPLPSFPTAVPPWARTALAAGGLALAIGGLAWAFVGSRGRAERALMDAPEPSAVAATEAAPVPRLFRLPERTAPSGGVVPVEYAGEPGTPFQPGRGAASRPAPRRNPSPAMGGTIAPAPVVTTVAGEGEGEAEGPPLTAQASMQLPPPDPVPSEAPRALPPPGPVAPLPELPPSEAVPGAPTPLDPTPGSLPALPARTIDPLPPRVPAMGDAPVPQGRTPGVATPRPDLTDGRPWSAASSAMQGEVLQRPPRKLDDAPDEELTPGTRKAILLGAARNAVARGQLDAGIARFEEYLRDNADDDAVRTEYAGVLVTANRAKQAIAEYERLLAKDPRNTRLRLLLADVFVYDRDYRAAISELTAVLEATPGDNEVAARLARVYTFNEEFAKAKQIYDRYLSKIRPTDAKVPKALGALLLDLERPGDALQFLGALRAKDPQDLEVLANIVRAYSRLGERDLMRTLLREMETIRPKEIGVRLALAEILYRSEDFEGAKLVFEQLLKLKPGYDIAIIGLARTEIELFNPRRARQLLESFQPAADVARNYFLTLSEYHQLNGEVVEAKQVYIDLLRRNPEDIEVRLALAKLYEAPERGSYELALGEYAKVPPRRPYGRRARLGFATTKAKQRRFPEAIDGMHALLREDPGDAEVLGQLVRTLADAKQPDRAVAVARAFLAGDLPRESQALTVRSALGYALLKDRKWAEAARNYEILLSRAPARTPDAYYGLAKALQNLGYAERAAEIVAQATGPGIYETRSRVKIAQLYSQDMDDITVLQVVAPLLGTDPYFLPGLIIRLDSQIRMAGYDANVAAGFETAHSIMRASPANLRGNLGAARLYLIAQAFKPAIQQYARTIELDPEYVVARLEKARTQYNDKQFGAARSTYTEILSPSPHETLIASVNQIAQAEPRLRPFVEPYLAAHTSGPRLRSELARVAGAMEEDVRYKLLRACHDYDAREAVCIAAELERDAKELKDYKYFSAVDAFARSNDFEADNVETTFDQGQAHAVLKETHDSIRMYAHTLDIEPSNHGALVGIDRATAEISPQLWLRPEFFTQRGRDGLANIDRKILRGWARLPFGEEDEYVDFGYAAAFYKPQDDTLLTGNIPFTRVQKRLSRDWLYYGQLNVEQYPNRISTRPTFDTGFIHKHSDCTVLRANIFHDNVIENGESLRDDVNRLGIGVGGDYRITRIWNVTGDYQFANYSDDNSMHQVQAASDVSLTLPPKQLRLIASTLAFAFEKQSIFGPNRAPDVRGVTYPYFSPKFFMNNEVRVEWKHWLSRDYFTHSNQAWYSLSYGLAVDSAQTYYQDLRAAANYDYCSWLTLGVEMRTQLSKQYDMFSAMGYLIVRFR